MAKETIVLTDSKPGLLKKLNTNFSELYSTARASGLTRVAANVTATGTQQTIKYTLEGVETPFSDTDYVLLIIDDQNLGYELISKDTDGFTITFIFTGQFSYIAIKTT